MSLFRSTNPVTAIYRGTTTITSIYRGTTLLWSPNGARDDFDQDDGDLNANWTRYGGDSDGKIVVTNGLAREYVPDGLIGTLWDLRANAYKWNVSTAAADDGYIEARMGTRGSGYDVLTAPNGYPSILWHRANNTGSTHTDGVGFEMRAGHCWIVRRVASDIDEMVEGGTFQSGDRLRLISIGDIHTLYVQGELRARWDDSVHHTAHSGASYRSMVIHAQGGKKTFGPRQFSPSFDYVEMG